MSSKLTKISIALLLSAVVAPSVFATIILSPEEEQAVRTAQPTTVKKIAQDAVSTATASGVQSNLDAYEQRLGGDEETIKTELGIGGFTSILEDIRATKAKIGVGANVKAGLDQLIVQTGVVAVTVTEAIDSMGGGGFADITARIDQQPQTDNLTDINAAILEVNDLNAPAGTLTQAIGAVRAQINAPGAGSLRALAAAERARIGAGAHIAAATTDVITRIVAGTGSAGSIAQDLNDQIARIDATPNIQMTSAIDATRTSIGPVVTSINSDLAVQVLLLDVAPALATGLGTTRTITGPITGTINADLEAARAILEAFLTGPKNIFPGNPYAGPMDLVSMINYVNAANNLS
jgi:hypothetical protein